MKVFENLGYDRVAFHSQLKAHREAMQNLEREMAIINEQVQRELERLASVRQSTAEVIALPQGSKEEIALLRAA